MLTTTLEILQNTWNDFLDVLPNILQAIILFIVGWLIAKLVARIIRKVLSSIGIDKLAQKLNEIELIEKTNYNIVPSQIFSKIVYYIILLLFAIAATEILNFAAISQLVVDILNYIPQLIAAIIVLAIGLMLAEFIKNIVLTTTRSLGIPSAKIIASFVFYFILLITIVTALSQMGIDTGFIRNNLTVILAGGIFAFGLGYGLASKDTMANFLASFYSKNKLNIGETITIDGSTGKIIAMDSNTLTLRAENENRIIVPLHKISAQKVEIHS